MPIFSSWRTFGGDGGEGRGVWAQARNRREVNKRKERETGERKCPQRRGEGLIEKMQHYLRSLQQNTNKRQRQASHRGRRARKKQSLQETGSFETTSLPFHPSPSLTYAFPLYLTYSSMKLQYFSYFPWFRLKRNG